MTKLIKINGKKYRRVGEDEVIKEGALHTIYSGFYPIRGGGTKGDKPKNFSPDRVFYNVVKD